jgi:shikimate dehydrogenase
MVNSSAPKIYGVLGYPAKHSLSPAMHNAAFRALKINAEYKIFEEKPEELGGFLGSLAEKKIHGLNVTVPYKEKVIPFLNSISSEAKTIAAVNTIRVCADKLEGFNTDGEGFLKHLIADLSFHPKDKRIAIIGAGGAAKAISVYLCQVAPKAIKIYDIERTKTIALIDNLKDNFKNVQLAIAESIEELAIKDADLLVNATAVGMKATDACLVQESLLHKNILVYDLIYNPPETKLLARAQNLGAKTSNGLGMLLHQGMLSFSIWTGKAAPRDIMWKALEESSKNARSHN